MSSAAFSTTPRLFVETQLAAGIVVELPQAAAHYLVRLKQFGRIAIVTDQSWVRIASRIESALLPYVSYEVYPVAQRDHALAWVKGAVDTRQPRLRAFVGFTDRPTYVLGETDRGTRPGACRTPGPPPHAPQ